MEHRHFAFSIVELARLYRRRFDERTRSFGVTGPQMRALVQIMRNPGINQGVLAERLDVEPITTCRMVDRLEHADFVERRRDPQDRRAWQLYLTKAAEPIASDVQEIGQALLDLSLEGILPEEIEAALSVLSRIRENLTKMPDEENSQVKEAVSNV